MHRALAETGVRSQKVVLKRMKCDVFVEIPKGSREKYELGPKGNLVFEGTYAIPFPANYGSILLTLAEDDDPVDCIIAGATTLQRASIVQVTPLGVLYMVDRGINDEKVVAVLESGDDLARAMSLDSLTDPTKEDIQSFLYKIKTGAGELVQFNGWGDSEAAEVLIHNAQRRYEQYA